MDEHVYLGFTTPLQWARFIKHRKKKMVLHLAEPPYWDHRIDRWQEHRLMQMFTCNPNSLSPIKVEIFGNGQWMNLDMMISSVIAPSLKT